MSYPQEVKDRAYTIDPACWLSYSGRPKNIKRYMDSRREAALILAQTQMREEGWVWTEEGHFVHGEN